MDDLARWRKALAELEAVLRALDASPEEWERALALLDAPRAARQVKARIAPLEDDLGPLPWGGDLLRTMRRRRGCLWRRWPRR